MPSTETKTRAEWCIHLQGPDDLIPMPGEATAKATAESFNRFWTTYLSGDHLANSGIVCQAIVKKWPYEAGHREALAALAEYDPDGWLSEVAPEDFPFVCPWGWWQAVLAPTETLSARNRTIARNCKIDVVDGAPLIGEDRNPIGSIANALVRDGLLIAYGSIIEGMFGEDAPPLASSRPTFSVGVDFKLADLGRPAPSVTIRSMTIGSVLVGGPAPEWSDDDVAFLGVPGRSGIALTAVPGERALEAR